ncbi:hypothetical protein HPB49_021724 [Dermacentor silvarum]|uniref:Uncharacterized protein n=1 Tax=Dermacentor silvarum TaxID=543639 RepID=A0ACB8CHB6_DERSI|nr:hypothetical protein HPB49_021724 [Dermacentor silvarum]
MRQCFKVRGAAYAYDDVESSTDSDEEVIQQLHHSASLQGGFLNSTSSRKVSSMGHSTDHAHGNGHLPQPDLVSLAENGHVVSTGAEAAEAADTSRASSKAAQGSSTVRTALQYENGAFLKAEDSPLSLAACGGTDEPMLLDLAEEELRCVAEASGLRGPGPSEQTTRCGALELMFEYNESARKVMVTVLRAHDLPSRDRGGANSVQVALFQLPDVTLMVSVYYKRSMKRKDMIGWFSLGLNSSGEEELSHWNDMRESKGEQMCRWHVLLDS